MNRTNRRAPVTTPCSTPLETVHYDDRACSTRTHCVRLVRKIEDRREGFLVCIVFWNLFLNLVNIPRGFQRMQKLISKNSQSTPGQNIAPSFVFCCSFEYDDSFELGSKG